jgi:hypothetical protein
VPIKFIHAADLHIDSPLTGLDRYEGAPVEELRNSTRAAFQNLIGLAIEERPMCQRSCRLIISEDNHAPLLTGT